MVLKRRRKDDGDGGHTAAASLLLLLPASLFISPPKEKEKKKHTKKISLHQHGKYQADIASGNNDTSWATTIGNKHHVAGRRSSLHHII